MSSAARSRSMLSRWVDLWDEREPASVLALIRVLLALTVLVDLATMAAHGATTWLWASDVVLGVDSAWLLWGGLVLSALGVATGCFTRVSAVSYVALSAHAAIINAPADRAIDRAVRIVFLILAFSPAGKAWSIDAKRATGTFRGVESPQPAWPRYLIFGQLVLIYFGAGLAKGGTHWYPWGSYRALYLTLREPILAAGDFTWLSHPVPYFATQVATAATHLWELSAVLLLVAAHYRRTPERPGRLRRFFNRVPLRDAYVAIGVAFHLTLALTLRLGIFPFAMLACFPAFFRPEEIEGAARALVLRLRGLRLRRPSPPLQASSDRAGGSRSPRAP